MIEHFCWVAPAVDHHAALLVAEATSKQENEFEFWPRLLAQMPSSHPTGRGSVPNDAFSVIVNRIKGGTGRYASHWFDPTHPNHLTNFCRPFDMN